MRAVIVSVMPGVCAVLAHVRGLSNLIGDTSCLSYAPALYYSPRFVTEEGGKKKVGGGDGGGCRGRRGALILNLSPSRSPFARPSVSLSLSVANKHVTMRQPRRQSVRRKKGEQDTQTR